MADAALMRRCGWFFIKHIKNKMIDCFIRLGHHRLTVLSDLLIIIRRLTINRILSARFSLRGKVATRRIFVFSMINKSDVYVN